MAGESDGTGSEGVVLDPPNNPDPSGGDKSGNPGSGGDSKAADFLSALNADNREYFTKKGWKGLDQAITSYRELERSRSNPNKPDNAKKPDNNSDPDSGQQTPKSAAEYKFKLPDNVPKEGFYDEGFAKQFAEKAFAAKLSPEQAQAIHDWAIESAMNGQQLASQQSMESLNKRIGDTHKDLTKAWGDPATPAFKQNLEMARRAMANLDPELKGALEATGVIVKQDGKEVVTNAVIMRALAKAGSTMFAEDSIYGNHAAEANPFDPKTLNLTRQGQIVKQDRELAKTLIRAAGVEKDWGHFLNS